MDKRLGNETERDRLAVGGLRSLDSSIDLGRVPLTYRVKLFIDRKQNLAGVQKEKRTGSTCAVSMRIYKRCQDKNRCMIQERTDGHRPVDELSLDHIYFRCLLASDTAVWPRISQDIDPDEQLCVHCIVCKLVR